MVSIDGYAALLTTTYGLLAVMMKTPELVLKDDETALYARAIADAQKHFPIPVLDPKWVAVGALASTAFVIHKRILTDVSARKKLQGGKSEGPPAVGNVVTGAFPAAPTQEPAPWFSLGGNVPN